MMRSLVRTLAIGCAALAGSLLSPPGTVWAQTGTVVGQVVDATQQQPIASAQVFIPGTSLGSLSTSEGTFRIPGVPAGPQTVRVTIIGYQTVSQDVSIPPGGTATVNFQLAESAVELGAIVVTATGREQTVREIGSSVGVVDVENVELAPVTSFSDLIQGRAAGALVLQSSGTTGSGSRIRIRGSNSISLSNAPLLVIDGVRVENDPYIEALGGLDQGPSALDDLNPENIATIEILRGPAASALYGTAAANGVIQVTTKRGRAGESSFRAWGEGTALRTSVSFPANVQALDADGDVCPVLYQATDADPIQGGLQPLCTPVQTVSFNPLENDQTTVFDGGTRWVYGASMSGGGDNATFYLSAERTDEESVYDSDNFVDRYNLQANVTGQVAENLRVRGTVGYVETELQLPQSDNSLFGALGMALYGDADSASVANTDGYENSLDFHYDWKTLQESSRLTASAAADFQPTSWLSFNGSAGLDRIVREQQNRIPRVSAYQQFGGIYESGWIQSTDTDIYNIDTNLSGSAVFSVSRDLISTTTAGAQYIKEEFHQLYGFGATLIPGVEESLAGATTDFDTDEGNILNATVSAYVQQQFAWRDRVFINAAVRGDENTAFGTDIGWIWYPAVSGSWVLSEETFFPEVDALDELRVRAAYGQAGLRPGATDALLSFAGGVGVFNNLDVPAITINELGNAELEPERSREWELGFESGLLNGRLGVEMTYYNKESEDALIERPLPPSPGGSEQRWENLGRVSNTGLETLITGQAVRNDDFTWNFSLSGSVIDNELEDLGTDAEGNPIPPIGSGVQRFVEGYPLGGWWAPPIQSWEDADGNGFLGPDEVQVGIAGADGMLNPDSAAFQGDAFPTREFSLGTDVTLWNLFRVSALFDYKGGHKLLNYTRGWRCSFELNCADAFDEGLPLEQQAAIVGLSTYGTYAGWMEDADFVKFRELAITFFVPDEWVGYARADNLRVTLAGRNLATWTDYSGLDPEVNWAGQANFTSGDFASLPPNRVFTLRLDVSF